MPKNHGLFKKIDPPLYARCLFGINRVFYIIGDANFHKDNAERCEKVRKLWMHAEQVENKLLASLDLFQLEIGKIEKALNEPRPGGWDEEVAGIAADSIINYLSMFADDLGRLVPYVIDYEWKREESPSFLAQKSKMTKPNPPLFPQLKPLFDRLDNDPNSWWKWALKRGVGVRQRVVHFTDFISFAGTKKEENEGWTASAYLWGENGRDFLNGLKPFFTNLCEWLDALQELLEGELIQRSIRLGFDWRVDLKGHIDNRDCVRLPWVGTEWKDGKRVKEIPSNLWNLPVCDGSDPFD